MLLPVLLLFLLTGAALTLSFALTMTRRTRVELEQRLSLLPLASQRREPEAASGAAEKPKTGGSQLERLLLLDHDHPWVLKTSSGKLAFAAIASAALTWIVCHRLLGAPNFFSAGAACLGAYLALRFVVLRERSRLEFDLCRSFSRGGRCRRPHAACRPPGHSSLSDGLPGSARPRQRCL